jgi:hypothetical protein
MTPDKFSITDPATWGVILSAVAAVLTNALPGHDFASYVPAVSILVAGLVASFVLFAKHHFAAAVQTAAGTIQAASTVTPKPDTAKA